MQNMIDHDKRKTLKTIVVATSTVATGSVSAAYSPARLKCATQRRKASPSIAVQELGQVEVSTRLSVKTNDIEVVITNAGHEQISITQMTPRIARVARGEFDFSELLSNGPLHLEAGASVTVPIQHKPVSAAVSASSLSDVLKNSMSVIADTDSFASVSILESTAVAA